MFQMLQNTIPDGALMHQSGIGLRKPHYQYILTHKPDIHWCEVHSENFFAPGGIAPFLLENIRALYPVSLHGVGLSLGSASALDKTHLSRLKTLVDRTEPMLVSEHISWSMIEGTYVNDLLPLPYTEESLKIVIDHIDELQNVLKRQILVENPSTYLQFTLSSLTEWDFMGEVARKSGCGILLDINNIYVSSHNHGFDPLTYLAALPQEAIGEIHLAGHASHFIQDSPLLIDDHGSEVAEPVWALYKQALAMIGPRPTLIEWDTNIPAFEVLYREAQKADAILSSIKRQSHETTHTAAALC